MPRLNYYLDIDGLIAVLVEKTVSMLLSCEMVAQFGKLIYLENATFFMSKIIITCDSGVNRYKYSEWRAPVLMSTARYAVKNSNVYA